MRLRQFSLGLVTLIFFAATSPLMAQTSSDSTTFLPLINQQAPGDNATEVEVAAFVDSAVSPPVEIPTEQVIPFSLREVGAVTAATTAADIRLPPLDVEQLRQEDRAKVEESSALRIGVVRTLPQAVSAASADGSPGRWHPTSDGGRYWTLTIESPDAKAIRVHIENLTIPDGGHVMVYNRNNVAEVFGPYRQVDLYGSSDLWTASIFGSVVTLEYYAPPGVELGETTGFQVTEISHLYVDLSTLLSPQLLTCHNDVTCSTSWIPEGNGVAGMGTIGGSAGVLWCSGALLNDLDNETFVGYFLTANHCLNSSDSTLGTQAQANTVEYYWRYQTPTCNGTAPNPATVPRTATGADLISRQTRDAGNDHAFLRIRGALPGGLTLVGWDTAAFSSGNASTGIHHPDGSFKRLSSGAIHSSDTNYWNVNWSSGTTEPGSSGSPLFDSAHRLRGQLWGDNRTCPAPGATARSVYGRFNVTYPNIRRWLEIGGTINVNSSYTGTEEGTPTRPFRTASAANTFAWNGARIKFRTGSYPGPITFTKQVTLIADGGMITIGN